MIIGLSGYARSGKNTVADMLGSDYRQVSFAEPMRKILLLLNPLIASRITTKDAVEQYGWDVAKVQFPEIRRLLQVLGTEVGREMFGQDIWVELATKDVSFSDNVVFTDVRFPNEAQAIIELGGEVWRINREGVGAVNDHPSDHSLDDWKFHRVIENNGTLGELRIKVMEK